MKKKDRKLHKGIVITIVVVVLVVLVVIKAGIEIAGNKRSAENTSKILMDRIISVMKQNEQDEKSLLESMKEDYIIRAQAIAYMLENNPEAENDVDELCKIARLVSVDEIHLFNEDGVIYSGTVPKYFGLSIDAGEQISYFKPMLEDKTLVMCQDITPNTAEQKSMMYANVWNDAGTYIVQVGIEPTRLLEKIKDNEISEVIQGMPMYEGVEIYVADKERRGIVGSTDLNVVGMNIDELGFDEKSANSDSVTYYTLRINKQNTYCAAKEYENYIVVISQSVMTVNRGLFSSILVVLVYLIIAVVAAVPLILSMSEKVQQEEEKRLEEQEQSMEQLRKQISIIQAVSREFTDIIIIDSKNRTAAMVKMGGKMVDLKSLTDYNWRPYEDTWRQHIEKYVIAEDAQHLAYQVRLSNVEKALETAKEYVCGYRMKYKDEIYNYQVKFVHIDTEDGERGSIVASFQNINDILETERKRVQLEKRANTDELTGLYNRNAYEEAMQQYRTISPAESFAVIAMDVNGLKVINDTLGHEAGDELIRGAAECMKKCFSGQGRIYRTGGDEFFALVKSDDTAVEKMLDEFEDALENWSGKIVKEVSVSYGCATKHEFPNMTPTELAKAADARMYKFKQRHYSKLGIDRRGQQAAFKSICESYVKVLKVNLTDDTYQPLQLSIGEKSDNISFSKSVAEVRELVEKADEKEFSERMDLPNLREFFKSGNDIFCLYYRRLIGTEYKRVMLEIVRAPEYTDDNQAVFLYLKNIEPI